MLSVSWMVDPEAVPVATTIPSRNNSTVKVFVTFPILKTGAVALVRSSLLLVPESLSGSRSGAVGVAGVEVSIRMSVDADSALVAEPLTVCRAV